MTYDIRHAEVTDEHSHLCEGTHDLDFTVPDPDKMDSCNNCTIPVPKGHVLCGTCRDREREQVDEADRF